jgi:D-beta-D-heptose 7-phosphate kinase/D-beta-D-heptose 1-phosphate adenosyltransferase
MRVLVVGDLILDRYLHCTTTDRHTDTGPILRIDRTEDRPGGAGAVAMLCESLGADVTLFAGDRCPLKLRTVIDGKLAGPRLDYECTDPIDLEPPVLDGVDCVLISDYGKGVCTPALLRTVIDRAECPVLVDPARGEDWERYRGATCIKCNLPEAQLLCGPIPPSQCSTTLADRYETTVIVTAGADGLYRNGEHFPASPRTVVDVTGAGDTVLAVLGVTGDCRLAVEASGWQVEQLGVRPLPLQFRPTLG